MPLFSLVKLALATKHHKSRGAITKANEQANMRPFSYVCYDEDACQIYARVCSIFNPSPALEHLTPEMYSLCDILCLNETEASMLTGSDVRDPQVRFACMCVDVLCPSVCDV